MVETCHVYLELSNENSAAGENFEISIRFPMKKLFKNVSASFWMISNLLPGFLKSNPKNTGCKISGEGKSWMQRKIPDAKIPDAKKIAEKIPDAHPVHPVFLPDAMLPCSRPG